MTTTVPDDRARAPRFQWVIAEPVIAAVAARAAVGVPGVVRLEPGLTGLASHVGRSTRQKIKGLAPAATEGVRVTAERRSVMPSIVPSISRVSVDLVTAGGHQAAAVARAVQREVTRAVADATGLTPQAVMVSIMDVDTDTDTDTGMDTDGTGVW
ncbi:Asp23/Gls24 family envelope stress response protein [Streptomyces sp. NPDC091376]|uniref:Asp23/Gls24 family envelope stress response protein n=1 Tax=Streptomyces sp. NPDC091376 TaxID=3365994 RepID=UPI00381B65D1